MKRIYLGLLIASLAAGSIRAQGSATQQQLDQLSASIEDLSKTVAQDSKRIDALEKELGDLRDKVNTPAPTGDYASNDELKKLAEQVQEIDRKRLEDRDVVLKSIKALSSATGGSSSHIKIPDTTATTTTSGGDSDTSATPPGPQTGHYYVIKQNDRLSAIVKAYRDAGVKVTTSQVIKANPGLDPNKLYVGKKIFIPDPDAK